MSVLASSAWGQIYETNLYLAINRLVPDSNLGGIEDRRTNASQIAELTGVKVYLKIAGNFNGDIYAYLRHTSTGSNNSHLAVLLNRPGRDDAYPHGYPDEGLDVLFSDQAAHDIHTYRSVVTPPAGSPLTGEWQADARFISPLQVTTSSMRWASLTNLNGMAASGEWMLFVADCDAGGSNSLVSWGLELTGKALPVLTWAQPSALTYGSQLTATELGATADVPGTFQYHPPLGTRLNVGLGQKISVIFVPDNTNQYAVANAVVTIDVLPRELTVTAWDTNKVYGEELVLDGMQFTAAGLADGDVISNVSLACDGLAAVASAGSYPITPINVFGNFGNSNYAIQYVEGAMQVAPANLVGRAESATRYYGQANPVFVIHYTGFVNGEDEGSLTGILAVSCEATTNSPVGEYPIVPSGQTAANYTVTYENGILSVLPAGLLVKALNATRSYGQTNPVFGVDYEGLVNGEEAGVLGGELVFACEATTNSPVGEYAIVPSGLVATNYSIGYSNGVLTVGANVLTVQVDNQSRVYGADNPALTGSVTGLQNGDDITAQFSTAADVSSPVGDYTIEVQLSDPGQKLGNYLVVTNGGMLRVNPAGLVVRAESATRYYGQANPVFVVHYTGFVNGEDEGSLTGILAVSCEATTNSAVGEYPIVPSGQTAANYTVTYEDGTLRVLPAGLLVKAGETTKLYGQTNPVFEVEYEGLVNGEEAGVLSGELVFDCEAMTNSPVGEYAIVPSGLMATNYSIGYSNGVLTIDPAPSYCVVLSSTNMAAPGEPVTFFVSVGLEPPSGVVPEGEVSFKVDGADYGQPVQLNQGQGSLLATFANRGLYSISVEYVGNTNILGSTNVLSPPQLVNVNPEAATLAAVRTASGTGKISLNYLLANSHDGAGGAVAFKQLNPVTANGGSVSVVNGWIVYTPPSGNTNADIISYTIEDSLGVESTGYVTISSTPDISAAAMLSITGFTNQECRVEINGTPWGTYSLEASDELSGGGGWRSLGVFSLDHNGLFQWADATPTAGAVRFYRAKYQGEIAVTTAAVPLLTEFSASTYLATPGTAVAFNLQTAPALGTTTPPQGAIQIKVDGTNFGSSISFNAGEAEYSTTALPWGRHEISAVFGGDATFPGFSISLDKLVVIDSPPSAGDYNLVGATSRGIKMPVNDLLAQVSDPDGESVTVGLASIQSAEGGTLTTSDGWIFYKPPAGQLRPDSFRYLAQDSLGMTNTGLVNISPVATSQNFPAIQIVELATDSYRLQFSGVPWLGYSLQYATSPDSVMWTDLAQCYADSQGLVSYDFNLPATGVSYYFRAVSDDNGGTASPFQRECWENFLAHTNNRVMNIWSTRSLPSGWPNAVPEVTWNTNCLIYGMEGFTAISPCNEFQNFLGQIPATLLTKRHAMVRGHHLGNGGLLTNHLAGFKVWLCTTNNSMVSATIAADLVRVGINNGQYCDYGILFFTEDVPASIKPMSVMTLAEFGLFCYPNSEVPYLVFGTEQAGHVATLGDPIQPFVFPMWKGGDSGSPDFFISPDNKLVLISNRGGTGVCPQMMADVDALTIWAGLNPADYQLDWYDMSPWYP